jgi:hypothetical protein
MMRRFNRRPKMEFSKKIFIGVTIGVILVVIFSCVMIWRTGDLSPLMYLIPSVFVELATATGFYYNKARDENTLKISKSISHDENNQQI